MRAHPDLDDALIAAALDERSSEHTVNCVEGPPPDTEMRVPFWADSRQVNRTQANWMGSNEAEVSRYTAFAKTARAKIVNPDSMSNKQYNCAD